MPPPANQIITPAMFLDSKVGGFVTVKLKWGNEYRGLLASYDPYFNIKLSNCSEFVNGRLSGELGDVLIRCNNVMTISPSADQQ